MVPICGRLRRKEGFFFQGSVGVPVPVCPVATKKNDRALSDKLNRQHASLAPAIRQGKAGTKGIPGRVGMACNHPIAPRIARELRVGRTVGKTHPAIAGRLHVLSNDDNSIRAMLSGFPDGGLQRGGLR